MNPLRARAPGKLILIGEHSAVFGRPALIGTLGLYFDVEIRPASEPGVRIHADDMPPRQRSWSELQGDSGALLEFALGETRRRLDRDPADFAIHIRSEIPVGAGFGSSAALACAVPAAVLAWAGCEPVPETLASIAFDIERKQHGRPSGIDHGTILAGGFVEASIGETGVRELTPFPISRDRLRGLHVYDTGTPDQTTGEMVTRVRKVYEKDPAATEQRLDRMAEAAVLVRNFLSGTEPADSFVNAIRSFHSEQLALGAVPPAIASIIEQIEKAGGAAKLSGAGAADGEQAGALLVYHERSEARTALPIPVRFRRIDAALGGPGLTVDKAG